MRWILLLLLPAVVARADDTVTFRLPNACGDTCSLADFDARYRLLVYQGIP